jgi:hypothetical protein
MTSWLCASHQQVLAVVVKHVNVMAWERGLEACTHLHGKHLVPQALRRPYLVEVARPSHFHTAARARSVRAMK